MLEVVGRLLGGLLRFLGGYWRLLEAVGVVGGLLGGLLRFLGGYWRLLGVVGGVGRLLEDCWEQGRF